MKDDRSAELIKETKELNDEFKKQLEVYSKQPTGENWDKLYIINLKWAEAVNALKKHDVTLLLNIQAQFNFSVKK